MAFVPPEPREFVGEFAAAQKAFAAGGLDVVASQLHEQSTERARRRADAVKALRRPH